MSLVDGSIQSDFPSIEQVFADLPDWPEGPDGFPVGQAYFSQPPTVASLFSRDASVAPYDLWAMETIINWSEGLGFMPVSGYPSGTGGQNGVGVLPTPGDAMRKPAQIPRLCAPFGTMAVFWTARRFKLQPQVPMPVVNDNAVFADATFRISPPVVYQDDTLFWDWSAAYFFLLKKPVWLLDGLNPGASPAHTMQPSDNKVYQSVFKQVY